jgi:hypothetical protein
MRQAFLDSTAAARRSEVVAMRCPKTEDTKACTVPALVLSAGRSRAHDVRRVTAAARRLLPEASVAIPGNASHRSIPTERPAELNQPSVDGVPGLSAASRLGTATEDRGRRAGVVLLCTSCWA